MLTCLVPVLFTFYIQCVLKLKNNNSGAKGLKKVTVNKNIQSDINVCYVWVCNLVPRVKERTQAEEFEHRVPRMIFGP